MVYFDHLLPIQRDDKNILNNTDWFHPEIFKHFPGIIKKDIASCNLPVFTNSLHTLHGHDSCPDVGYNIWTCFFLDHLEENYWCNNYHNNFLALAVQQLWWQHDFTLLVQDIVINYQLTSTHTPSAVTHKSPSLSHMHTHVKLNRGFSGCLLCLSFVFLSPFFSCQLSLPASSYSCSSLINVSHCSCSILPHSFRRW